MSPFLIALLSTVGVIVAVVLGFLIYFMSSPMPVVKLLRKGPDSEVKYPEGSDGIKDNVEIQKDLEYPSKYGKNNFDLYLPKNAENAPLILWVHGGAFVAGDKYGVENWCVMFANEGFAVASMNYEWAPEAAYPAQLIQITEALRAVQKIAAQSGKIDMSRVAVAGDSAGAHMASQFALIHTNPEFSKLLNITSPLEKDSLKCALLYCGPYNLKRMLNVENRVLRLFISRIGWSFFGKKNWKKVPLSNTVTVTDFVTSDYVPSYITDGNSNSFEGQGMELGEKLRSLGVTVADRYFPKEKYGEVTHDYQMDLTTDNAVNCFNDTIKFLNENLINRRDVG